MPAKCPHCGGSIPEPRLPAGYRFERNGTLPSHHRIPFAGDWWTVVGPAWGAEGEGSFGTGRTKNEAARLAKALHKQAGAPWVAE